MYLLELVSNLTGPSCPYVIGWLGSHL